MTISFIRRHWFITLTLLVLFLIFLFFLNLFFGSVPLDFQTVWFSLTSTGQKADPAHATIVLNYRLPQAITAMLSGAGLAVAGLLMQTLFRNPLADPSILGISSGASLGVAVLLLTFSALSGHVLSSLGWISQFGVILAAFTGSMLVLLLITWLGRLLMNIVSLLIAGIMIAYVTGALVGIAKYFSHKEDLQAFVLWGLGSFSNVGSSQIPFFTFATGIGLILSYLMVKPLNMLLLGERYAANLGLNVKRSQLFILLVSGYLTAVITAYAGPIAFIGLAVPHLARNIFRDSNHHLLLPAVMVIGASLALFCNLIARLPGFESSLPVNAVTSLIGAPIVIWVIVKKKHLYSSEL
jgi:iron complex transport system permease protein